MKNQRGFTILELITVVILLGVIAAFAIPDYRTSNVRAVEKSMAHNLATIRDAINLYLVKEDVFPNDANFLQDLLTINTNLNIYVTSVDGETYACTFPVLAGNQYECMATYANPNFVLETKYLAGGSDFAIQQAIHCFDTSCPQCANQGSGGCPY